MTATIHTHCECGIDEHSCLADGCPGNRVLPVVGDTIPVSRLMLQVLVDTIVGSMNYGSGMLDKEEVDALREVAVLLGRDPLTVTPDNVRCQYTKTHEWQVDFPYIAPKNRRADFDEGYQRCNCCGKTRRVVQQRPESAAYTLWALVRRDAVNMVHRCVVLPSDKSAPELPFGYRPTDGLIWTAAYSFDEEP